MLKSSDLRWINGAVQAIQRNTTRRMDKPDGRIVAYRAKNCIRVDIREVKQDDRS